jgi:hypothetical protein
MDSLELIYLKGKQHVFLRADNNFGNSLNEVRLYHMHLFLNIHAMSIAVFKNLSSNRFHITMSVITLIFIFKIVND